MLITALSKAVMHLFFSTVKVRNSERMPASGPVLVVANHHSGLIDPVALIATLPRTPRFLAKAALWLPKYLPLRPFLRLAAAIPVHRQADGGGNNADTFEACRNALSLGGVVAIFGEGFSHDLPGLMDLKTGAARIALGTTEPVAVLPVGLVYDDRATFRSRAMTYVGEPIFVRGSVGGDENRDHVRVLTEQISDGLDAVAPSWESWEAHHGARVAARLAAGNSKEVVVGEALSAINAEVDADTDEAMAILQAVEVLEMKSARLGLDIETVVDQPREKIGWLNTLSILKTVLWFLPTMLGRLLNLPPFALIGRLTRTQDLNFRASAKVLFGVFLYPLWWLMLSGLGWWLVGPAAAVVLAVTVPGLGYLSARKFGRLRRLNNRREVRARVGRDRALSLEAARQAVLDATTNVLQRYPASRG